MRTALAFLLLLCLSRSSIAQPTPDPSFRALDARIQAELTRLRVPGAAVAVVHGDSLVHGFVFGRADESGRAITLDTPFMIGSISKSMTALLVMDLVDGGTVALDSPVSQYLPWFRPTGRVGWRRVTIRHLLNQNGGIPSSAGRMDWAHPDTSDAALERHARGLATVKLAHPPGTIFEYANANYALLGQVIQSVTGMSYEAYVRDHLFSPLAMSRSFTSLPAATRSGMALGYRLWFGHPMAARGMPFVRSNVPAGYLMASAADLARYAGVHLREGRYPGGRVVSSAAIEELHRPMAKMTGQWSYAMGWMSGTIAGQTVLWHNGLVPGFYAFMALLPQRHQGIVVLANVGDLFDLPRLNRAAFGALGQLWAQDPRFAASVCAMCPVLPQVPRGSMLAFRPIALVLLALQSGWIAWSGTRRRWRSRKGNVISLSLSLAWAALVLFLLPQIARMPLAVLSSLAPDLATVLYASVTIALGWAVVRMLLAGRRTVPQRIRMHIRG